MSVLSAANASPPASAGDDIPVVPPASSARTSPALLLAQVHGRLIISGQAHLFGHHRGALRRQRLVRRQRDQDRAAPMGAPRRLRLPLQAMHTVDVSTLHVSPDAQPFRGPSPPGQLRTHGPASRQRAVRSTPLGQVRSAAPRPVLVRPARYGLLRRHVVPEAAARRAPVL